MKSYDAISGHDKSAEVYDDQAAEYDWLCSEALFGLTYEYVKPGQSLLDIGIGTGLSSILFHKAGLRVYGLDGSGAMLKVCESKGFASGLKQHDIRQQPLPYADDSFDHVISIAVFNFIGELGPIFEEVARIIRDGGIFGFMVFELKTGGRDGRASYTGDDIAEVVDEEWEVKMFRHSDEYVSRLLRDNGFAVLRDHRFAGLKRPSSDEVVILKLFIARKGKP